MPLRSLEYHIQPVGGPVREAYVCILSLVLESLNISYLLLLSPLYYLVFGNLFS